MNRRWLVTATGVFAFGVVIVPKPPTAMAQTNTIYNTSYPSVVRVAIRSYNNPVGPILYVQTLGFQEYCKDVLPNEWFPSWSPQALDAGAIAIKMFAWYHTLHPITIDGFTFDVDNTTNFQQFKYLSGQYVTDKAMDSTWNTVYVPPNGDIQELDYRSGTPNNENAWFDGTNLMSQWGSEYWGSVGKLTFSQILHLYYPSLVQKYV